MKILILDDCKDFVEIAKERFSLPENACLSFYDMPDFSGEVNADTVEDYLSANLSEPTNRDKESNRCLRITPDGKSMQCSHILLNLNIGSDQRSNRAGVNLLKALRCKLGLLIPVIGFSFEDESLLQNTIGNDILAFDTGHSYNFIQLPFDPQCERVKTLLATMRPLDHSGLRDLVESCCEVTGMLSREIHSVQYLALKGDVTIHVARFKQILEYAQLLESFSERLHEVDQILVSYSGIDDSKIIYRMLSAIIADIRNKTKT